MKSLYRSMVSLAISASTLVFLAAPGHASAQSDRGLEARATRAIQHWTPERRAAASPRDLVIDERGLGYLRGPGGELTPHGHNTPAQMAAGVKDTTPPSISGMSPANGATVGAAVSFSATVTDASGVKSVSIAVRQGSGQPQTFAATQGAGGTWSVNLSGFTNGAWSWYVVAKDNAKPANTTTSPTLAFTVDTGGGGGGGDTIVNSPWTGGGVVQQAVGRIYFEMPSNSRLTRWAGYVCSGTVSNDATTGRSIIITAAHCVYDDAYKAFARNVLFIPNQDGTTGTGTDLNCANDPIGCWSPDFGVVDVNWTTRTFPDNVAWDYAYYVVNDSGAHSNGIAPAPSALDAAVTPMDVSFSAAAIGPVTNALGYSYSEDPNFMYCADPMEALDAVNYWLPNCGLSGGSSGGPWAQPFSVSTGNGTIISVNSWGYTNQPGMAGPKLAGTSASCMFARAKSGPLGLSYADGSAGIVVSGCP
jgi:hypothetical protein